MSYYRGDSLRRAAWTTEKKSITERIADTVKNIAEITAEATAQTFKAPEPKPEPTEETAEHVYVPEAIDAAAAPAPLTLAEPTEPTPVAKKRAAPKRASKRVVKAKKVAPAQEGV
jgi:hypothetical protein